MMRTLFTLVFFFITSFAFAVRCSELGCESNPEFDSSVPLNQYFSQENKNIGPLEVDGVYYLKDTVDLSNRDGVAIVGTGINQYRPEYNVHFISNSSRFVWTGGENKPMFVYKGIGLYWRGVSLWGQRRLYKNSPPLGPKAAIGLLCIKGEKGAGSGKYTIPQIAVHYCKTGLQWGLTEADGNADTTEIGFFYTRGCDYGMRIKHHMGLAYHINHYFCSYTDTCIRFDHGGRLKVDMFSVMSPSTMLSLGKIKTGGGSYHLGGLVIDTGAVEGEIQDSEGNIIREKGHYKIVVMDQHSPVHVTVEGHLNHGASFQEPVAYMKGESAIHFQDVVGMKDNMVVCESRPNRRPDGSKVISRPQVFVNECRFYHDYKPQNVIQEGPHNYTWRNCYTHWGEYIPDGYSSE